MVYGTRTIHFPVPIPHIDHSRSVSAPFWVSPRLASGRLRRLGGNIAEKSALGFLTWPGIMKNKSCASKFPAEPQSRNIQISAMSQKTSVSVYGNVRVFLMFCPPGGRGSGRPGVGREGEAAHLGETSLEEFWRPGWLGSICAPGPKCSGKSLSQKIVQC